MAVTAELLEQFEPAHSRQIGVDQLQLVRILRQFESLPDEACGFAGIKGLQKGLAACIGVDDAAARR